MLLLASLTSVAVLALLGFHPCCAHANQSGSPHHGLQPLMKTTLRIGSATDHPLAKALSCDDPEQSSSSPSSCPTPTSPPTWSQKQWSFLTPTSTRTNVTTTTTTTSCPPTSTHGLSDTHLVDHQLRRASHSVMVRRHPTRVPNSSRPGMTTNLGSRSLVSNRIQIHLKNQNIQNVCSVVLEILMGILGVAGTASSRLAAGCASPIRAVRARVFSCVRLSVLRRHGCVRRLTRLHFLRGAPRSGAPSSARANAEIADAPRSRLLHRRACKVAATASMRGHATVEIEFPRIWSAGFHGSAHCRHPFARQTSSS